MGKRWTTQTTTHDSPGTLMLKISAKLNRGHTPNGGAKCRLDRLKLAIFDKIISCYNSKTSTAAIAVNLVRSQVYHNSGSPLFAALISVADTCYYPSQHSERHQDLFSRFYRVNGRDRQTNR